MIEVLYKASVPHETKHMFVSGRSPLFEVLHNLDFGVGEAVELVDQFIDLLFKNYCFLVNKCLFVGSPCLRTHLLQSHHGLCPSGDGKKLLSFLLQSREDTGKWYT